MEHLTTSTDQGPSYPHYETYQVWILPYGSWLQGCRQLPSRPHGEDHQEATICWGGPSLIGLREPPHHMFMEALDWLRRTLWPHPSWRPPPTLRVPEPTGDDHAWDHGEDPWGSGSVIFSVNLMGPNGGNPSSLQLGPSGRSKFSARGRHYHMQ